MATEPILPDAWQRRFRRRTLIGSSASTVRRQKRTLTRHTLDMPARDRDLSPELRGLLDRVLEVAPSSPPATANDGEWMPGRIWMSCRLHWRVGQVKGREPGDDLTMTRSSVSRMRI